MSVVSSIVTSGVVVASVVYGNEHSEYDDYHEHDRSSRAASHVIATDKMNWSYQAA